MSLPATLHIDWDLLCQGYLSSGRLTARFHELRATARVDIEAAILCKASQCVCACVCLCLQACVRICVCVIAKENWRVRFSVSKVTAASFSFFFSFYERVGVFLITGVLLSTSLSAHIRKKDISV